MPFRELAVFLQNGFSAYGNVAVTLRPWSIFHLPLD